MITVVILIMFVYFFNLGIADVIWIIVIILMEGTSGLITICAALAGFLFYICISDADGRKSPLIPFFFLAAPPPPFLVAMPYHSFHGAVAGM